MPVCARPDHPKNRIHKQPIIRTGSSRVSGFASNQRAYANPLLIRKLITLRANRNSRSLNLEFLESQNLTVPEDLNVDWS